MQRLVMIVVLVSALAVISGREVRASSPSGPATAPAICFASAQHGWLARTNHVWTTTDGGRRWTISFTGAFLSPSGFQDTIGCSGKTVWVLFVGFGAAMNQKPYVLYRTTDGGLHWAARMEEGYFLTVYPRAHARKELGG